MSLADTAPQNEIEGLCTPKHPETSHPRPHDAARDMETDTRPQLAHRIHLLLRRELGQGIDVVRTQADPLYARDVLLVCDAMPGSELASLAQKFRAAEPAAAPAPGGDSGAPSHWPQGHSDFGASKPSGQDSESPLPSVGRPATVRHWLSPARWLGRP
jgi:hypothetical protein